MSKVAIIDNYDSFTYNLVHLVEKILHQEITVYRNDEIEEGQLSEFDKLILSPGPGLPQDAGITKKVIEKYFQSKPILGVCLGHQAIGEVFGGKLVNLSNVFHGVATPIKIIKQDAVFSSIPAQIKVGRYHSWVVTQLPEVLEVLATDNFGNIMALKHKHHNCYGVQYHPESILSEYGEQLLKNWLSL